MHTHIILYITVHPLGFTFCLFGSDGDSDDGAGDGRGGGGSDGGSDGGNFCNI